MRCILLHGLGQTPSAWDETVRCIGNRLDVSCPDVFQWLPDSGTGYIDLYRGLEEYCARFDEPFVLGGLSLGGILAMQYAIEHGEKVDSLILMGTQFSMPKHLLRLQNVVFRILPNRAFAEMGMSKEKVIDLCRSMITLDFRRRLRDIHCRTLVVCGEKDRTNLSAARGLKEQILGAELRLIPHSGHEINRDNPIELGKMMIAFIC